jgi:hypothetical protein
MDNQGPRSRRNRRKEKKRIPLMSPELFTPSSPSPSSQAQGISGASADATMSDSTSRTLWCLLKGGPALFRVTTPATANVYNLKELILAKKKNELKDIDADQLILLKVSTFLCFSRRERPKAMAHPAKLPQVDFDLESQDEEYLRSLDFKQDDKNVQQLTDAQIHISALWSDQHLGDKLRVFVKRRATGEGFVVSVYEWR